MTTLNNNKAINTYDFIEVGDTITLPLAIVAVKEGVIAKIRKSNGHAMVVTCTNGAMFALSRYKRNFVLTVA
jgi:hypothetical protein